MRWKYYYELNQNSYFVRTFPLKMKPRSVSLLGIVFSNKCSGFPKVLNILISQPQEFNVNFKQDWLYPTF